MNLSFTKKELRTIYKQKRIDLSEDEVGFLSKKIFENFIFRFKPFENQKINIFLSIKNFKEIDTGIFINYFFAHSIRVFVPKIQGENLVSMEIFPESEFEINQWNIAEPVGKSLYKGDFDFVLTPLLYCDSSGNRIGYGKGFYDRFFGTINKNSKKIGLNYFEPNEKIFDISDSDYSLDALITPDNVIDFEVRTAK